MILVDASVLIDFLAGRGTAQAGCFADILDRGIPFGLSPFTLLELLQGAATREEFATLRDYLGSQTIYELADGVSSFAAAAGIFFDLRRRGKTVRGSVDCLIAQTAIEHGLLLLHNDSDFDRIAEVSELRIY